MQQADTWITASSFSPDLAKSSPEEIYLDIEWSFSELAKGAEVYILYRQEEETEWKRADARSVGGPSYRATLVLSPQFRYLYQMVTVGSALRATTPTVVPAEHYRPIPPILDSYGPSTGGGIHMLFTQPAGVLLDFFKVQGITAIFLKDSEEYRRVDAKRGSYGYGGSDTSWMLELFVIGFDRVEIEVSYGDGTVHHAEIWPNTEEYYRFVDEWRP
jgi:hypothetical protein